MRIRQIKPSICTNEVLGDLGILASLIFERLFMVADREGRFELRPRRLQAQTIPMLNVSHEEFDQAVENLCKSGLLRDYEVDGKRYCLFPTWKKHQRFDTRETNSLLPSPVEKTNLTVRESETLQSRRSYAELRGIPGNSARELGTGKKKNSKPSSGGATSSSRDSPPLKPETPTRKKTEDTEPTPKIPASSADHWPHSVEAFAIVRESLTALAREIRMPPPDEQIILQVLDAARGAPANEIHETLRALYLKHKFDQMRSWAFIPVIIQSAFRTNHRS